MCILPGHCLFVYMIYTTATTKPMKKIPKRSPSIMTAIFKPSVTETSLNVRHSPIQRLWSVPEVGDFFKIQLSNFSRIPCLSPVTTSTKRTHTLIFPTPPLFYAPARGIPSEFLDETYRAKTRGMGLLYGENCTILTSAIFDWSTRVRDRRTDRQTELQQHMRA